MLGRFWRSHAYRAFSKSSVWRNVEKSKLPESSTPSSKPVLDMSMDFAPSEFDKKILLLSGRFKSREEIPNRIRYDTMDNAKSRLRIRVSNVMIILTILTCVGVIVIGKKKRKEGDTFMKRIKDRDNELRDEGRKLRERNE